MNYNRTNTGLLWMILVIPIAVNLIYFISGRQSADEFFPEGKTFTIYMNCKNNNWFSECDRWTIITFLSLLKFKSKYLNLMHFDFLFLFFIILLDKEMKSFNCIHTCKNFTYYFHMKMSFYISNLEFRT